MDGFEGNETRLGATSLGRNSTEKVPVLSDIDYQYSDYYKPKCVERAGCPNSGSEAKMLHRVTALRTQNALEQGATSRRPGAGGFA